MNGKTAKLIRKLSTLEGQPYRLAKKAWNATPKNNRGELRKRLQDELPAKPFCAVVREWRISKGITQKEAADILGMPFDTYTGYEYGRYVPPDLSLPEIRRRMNENAI